MTTFWISCWSLAQTLGDQVLVLQLPTASPCKASNSRNPPGLGALGVEYTCNLFTDTHKFHVKISRFLTRLSGISPSIRANSSVPKRSRVFSALTWKSGLVRCLAARWSHGNSSRPFIVINLGVWIPRIFSFLASISNPAITLWKEYDSIYWNIVQSQFKCTTLSNHWGPYRAMAALIKLSNSGMASSCSIR